MPSSDSSRFDAPVHHPHPHPPPPPSRYPPQSIGPSAGYTPPHYAPTSTAAAAPHPILPPPTQQVPLPHPPPLPPSSSSSSYDPPPPGPGPGDAHGRLIPGPGDPPPPTTTTMDTAGPLPVHQHHHHHHYASYSSSEQQQPQPPPPPPALGNYALPPPRQQPPQPQAPPPQPSQIPEYADVEQTLRSVKAVLSVDSLMQCEPRSRARQLAGLPPATFNTLFQNALDGLRLLSGPVVAERYAAEIEKQRVSDEPPAPPPPPEEDEKPQQQQDGEGGAGAGRPSLYAIHANMRPTFQKREERLAEPQECLSCHAKSSPEWRRGPYGPRTLCNACGLVYIKIMKRRAKGLPDEEDDDEEDGGQDSGDETDSR